MGNETPPIAMKKKDEGLSTLDASPSRAGQGIPDDSKTI
jgi:hypothetical protein